MDLTINAVSLANLVTLIMVLVATVSAYNSIVYTQDTHGTEISRNSNRIEFESGQRREAVATMMARYEQITKSARDAQERTIERLSKIEATQQVQGAVLQRLEVTIDRVGQRVGVPE